MKSLIFNLVVFFTFAVANINAQNSQMQQLINQSLQKVQQPTPEAMLNCISELKRIDAMYPDSIMPKFQLSLQSLNFALMNPQAQQTESILQSCSKTIDTIEKMKGANLSDVYTLRGMYYMSRIVQNPITNGPRYYIEVMQNYEKALKVNPENDLAKQMQAKFMEGMKQAIGQ